MAVIQKWLGCADGLRGKLLAVLLVALAVLAPLAELIPVSASYTLGTYNPTSPYHSNDFQPHVPGPLAYVWPGSGLGAWTGQPDGPPFGYQPPQAQDNSYSPLGALLTSTDNHPNRGWLIFALNFSHPERFRNREGRVWKAKSGVCGLIASYCQNYTGVQIYIPPEFDLSNVASNPGLITSTFAIGSRSGTITRASENDPWGPGWWIISLYGDIHFWPQNGYKEWYYIRINNVITPKIAGKYFFKIFLRDEFFNKVYPGMPRSLGVNGKECNPDILGADCWQGPDSPSCIGFFDCPGTSTHSVPVSGGTNATVPVENWPVLLVEGELNPGYMTGTIRYSSFNHTLYGQPINVPGKVWLVGVAINPYRSDHPVTGRIVMAMGYFNASAKGHYEVEGIAPGIYNAYASASGFPTQDIDNFTVLSGQSLHQDGYITPGAVLRGQLFSKHQFGDQPWPSNPRPVYIEIYASNDYSQTPIATSPLNLTNPPYMANDWDELYSGGKPTPRPVAFPWNGPSYYSTLFPSPPPSPTYNSHDRITCGGSTDVCQRSNGVGPAQYWWVDRGGVFTNGGGSTSFRFQFGVDGLYGIPTNTDGHVPQSYATTVNGTGPGQYWVRAWINGYTQTALDGATLADYPFEVSSGLWPGDVSLPMDLRVGSFINETVHLHNYEGTLTECSPSGFNPPTRCAGKLGMARGNRFLIAEVRDASGTLWGLNFTLVNENVTEVPIEINGFGLEGPDRFGVKFSNFNYGGQRDYGLPTGTYQIYLYMRGYLQQSIYSVSVTLSGNPTLVSNHMYRGAMLNLTVNSIDWEHPLVPRAWSFPGARVRAYVFNSQDIGVGFIGDVALTDTLVTSISAAGYDSQRGEDPYEQPLAGALCGGASPASQYKCTDPAGTSLVLVEWDGQITTDRQGPDLQEFLDNQLGGWASLGSLSLNVGFLWQPSLYRADLSGNFTTHIALPSDVYTIYGFTYGYVQHNAFSAYAGQGQVGDLRLTLLQGVNITLNILFEKESIITPTQFNMSMRVRVFNDQGYLVATESTLTPDNAYFNPSPTAPNAPFGLGRFTGFKNSSLFTLGGSYYVDPFAKSPDQTNGLETIDGGAATADGFLWYGTWNVGPGGAPVKGWQAFDSDPDHDGIPDFSTIQTNALGWGLSQWCTAIPAGTTQVRVFLAGMYDIFGDPLDAWNSGVLHTPPWDAASFLGEKIDSMWYGIDGYAPTLTNSYTGGWSVEVDTWNNVPATTWYPPAEAAGQGDSFHTIPGHPAGLFGYTGNSLVFNGLGPYAQQGTWLVSNAPLGGEASAIFHMDKRGYVNGTVWGLTLFNELIPVSGATITFNSQAENFTYYAYSGDGFFNLYLDPGDYTLQIYGVEPISNQGYQTINTTMHISPGQNANGVNYYLQLSGIPISEFQAYPIAVLTALAASVYLLRRKRR